MPTLGAPQIGTAFLACEESGASPPHREALLNGKADPPALTRGFTGRLGVRYIVALLRMVGLR
jgi:nitronate monooxygenase